ncbi:MAG: helix-turn-helix domain-containing protein [Bacteroidia bacterium]|nr:helix-turn-helix domain-containing protein [Bacteroidia bacterium]
MTKIIPAFNFTKSIDGNLGFTFTKLEESYSRYNATQPHRHKYYEVLFFNGSGGVHEIDFQVYNIHANSVHFVSPDQVHLLRRESHVSGFVISFSDDFFLETDAGNLFIDTLPFFNNPYVVPVLQLKENSQITESRHLLDKMQNEFSGPHADQREALQSWMKLFLILSKRIYSGDNKEQKPPVLRSEMTRNFKRLVEKEFRKIKSVSEYAELLNITAGHLSETIQKDIGKTAGEFIHDRLILEAKRLLYHSPKSIKEIATELNFEDPSYFTKFFKTHTENTPEQFRQTFREKYQ